jgi:hypothetical protein
MPSDFLARYIHSVRTTTARSHYPVHLIVHGSLEMVGTLSPFGSKRPQRHLDFMGVAQVFNHIGFGRHRPMLMGALVHGGVLPGIVTESERAGASEGKRA